MILKKASSTKYSIDETTRILKEFGLSKSKGTTQRLIREGKINAIHNGVNPDDRRSSHSVYEKEIYAFVIKSIPALMDFYDKIEVLEKRNEDLIKKSNTPTEVKLKKTTTSRAKTTAATKEETPN